MRRAREVILSLGGAAGCNSFTKFYLALLGQFPYANCASVPPEMVLLPRWCYFNLYAMSSWTRTIVVPLSIFSACKPVRQLPSEQGIAELFLQSPTTPLWPAKPASRLLSWGNLFLGLDWLYKQIEPWLGPIRRLALKRAAAWMREHLTDSDGLGAIFPPMIYTVISLRCLGVPDDAPEMKCGPATARRPDDRGGRHTALAAVLLAGVGHGPDAERPRRRGIVQRSPGDSSAPRVGCWRRKCGNRATGA